jgi:hypothetical protein
MDRNDLGALRKIRGVKSVWKRKDRYAIAFEDGTMMTAPNGNAHQLVQEAERLTLRARVLVAIATNKVEAPNEW